MASMAEKIKGARRLRRLTQLELAERAGVAQSVVSKLERGTLTNPSTDVLRRLARALNVSMDYLAGLYDEVETASVS
jgi:transcriptional regulator with XRE-family HTH domain